MRKHLFILTALLCGAPVHAADVDPYLPDDAQLVVTINVRQLLDAPLTKQIFPQAIPTSGLPYADDFPPFGAMLQALRLDPLRDIGSLVFAGPLPPRADKGVLVVRGKFNLPELQAVAQDRAKKQPERFQIAKAGERSVYQFMEGATATYGSFLDATTLVLAPTRAAIDEAIARKDGKQTPNVSKELRALLTALDARHTVSLAVVATDAWRKEVATPETEKLFANVNSISGGVTVSDGFQASGTILTGDAKVAGELRHFVEGLKAILSLAASDNKQNGPLLTALVAALKVASANQAVVIHGTATKEQLEKARKPAP